MHRLATFAIITGRCTWLVVKGNELMKEKIGEAIQHLPCSSQRSGSEALIHSLQIHAWISTWSVEGWSRYLDYIDEDLHKLSGRAIQEPVKLMSYQVPTQKGSPDRHAVKAQSRHTAWNLGWVHRLLRVQGSSAPSPRVYLQKNAHIREDDKMIEAPTPQVPADDLVYDASGPTFDFENLQLLQKVEEEIYSAVSVIKGNMKVLSKIRAYYSNIPMLGGIPQAIATSKPLAERLTAFEEKLQGFESKLAMHQTRGNALLKLATDRKHLVSLLIFQRSQQPHMLQLADMLQYQNMASNQAATREAIRSAKHTEDLTHEMSRLTERTKQETVMMRVISLVTVIFLPGTFISVSLVAREVMFCSY